MDKDRIAGTAREARGAAEEALGKLTGDARLEAKGKADKLAGKIQNAIGALKDTAGHKP
ncbi:CsbD family protein [Novosphingobium acidiphilum]|uniref:CsbD family protein n=1 Tax=Novosphingobium acidiphilum TaxID=505248 RepID=UPI0003F7D91A|nr:CsbD family protein [Novosphingobium acidiphilum]